MNLTTSYLGLQLRNPIIAGAGPLCDSVEVARRLEESGAGALVMHSLFEEQIELEQKALIHHIEAAEEAYAEATSYFPRYEEFNLAPQQYVDQLKRLKDALTIPVIASLNGHKIGGWIEQAARLEQAGADALELNLYMLAVDATESGEDIEETTFEILRRVLEHVKIPVCVKLSPFYTSMSHFAAALEKRGAAGLVLFNRFYQPDFNTDDLEVVPHLRLSDSSELRLRLRWLSILSAQVGCTLACSGGVHTGQDVVKALLAGADGVQVVSALLKNGPGYVRTLLTGLEAWMEEHQYTSVKEFRGAMNLQRCPDPAAHERTNYIRILQSWRI